MNRICGVIAAALLWGVAARAAPPSGPVVVELFTSQGCNSCPPADALLGELAHRPDVLALALHVTYWNDLGWTDQFSKLASSTSASATPWTVRLPGPRDPP